MDLWRWIIPQQPYSLLWWDEQPGAWKENERGCFILTLTQHSTWFPITPSQTNWWSTDQVNCKIGGLKTDRTDRLRELWLASQKADEGHLSTVYSRHWYSNQHCLKSSLMTGLNTLSASLQVIENCKKQLMNLMCDAIQRDFTSWRKG